MGSDPRTQFRAWLPHILMLGALVAALALLLQVAAPLFEPILLAAALATLTSPVLCEPLNRFLARRYPKLSPGLRRKIAGIVATVAIVFVALTPILLAVVSQAHNLGELFANAKGLILRNPDTIARIADAVVAQVEEINKQYQNIGLPAEEIGEAVDDFLSESVNVNSALLSFIFAGTGTVAQIALALVSLAYFHVDGTRIVRGLLAYSPLSVEQQERLVAQHRGVVLRLLNDTVVTAFAKGIVLGGVVYLIDHTLGSGRLPFLPIAMVAALITLLPLVGVTMVWLPMAGLAWSQGNRVGAVVLALCCWTSNFVIERYRARIGNRLHASHEWLGFLLFVGVIGGLLTYGPKGLVIGPFAVVMVITISRAWLPLYVADPANSSPVEPLDAPRAGAPQVDAPLASAPPADAPPE